MKLTFATLLATTLSAVYAQAATNAGVAINHPGYGDVINAGQPFTVTWTVTDNAASAINSIALMSGTSTNLQTYTQNILAGPISVSPAQYVWNVPANIETGSAYALAFKGANGQDTYSTYFTIIGAPPGTVNNTASSSTASSPAASAVVSSSSSSGPKASVSGSTAASTKDNASSSLKASMVGVVGAAIAVLVL